MNRKILSRLFYAYLKCLEKTVHVKWEGMESFNGNQVVGFWHEDSFAMNLLLREVTETDNKMSVLVTGDPRGDYIQYMIEKCRGDAVRIGYGFCDTGTLRELLTSLKEEKQMCIRDRFIDDNTLTVNVTRLRRKLEELGMTDVIRTKNGIGYMVEL